MALGTDSFGRVQGLIRPALTPNVEDFRFDRALHCFVVLPAPGPGVRSRFRPDFGFPVHPKSILEVAEERFRAGNRRFGPPPAAKPIGKGGGLRPPPLPVGSAVGGARLDPQIDDYAT